MTWGSDTVTDDDVILRDVHLTPTDGIGERQRNELKEYLYERSLQHVAEQGKIHPNRGGRPAEKSDMVEAWIRTKQASPEGMPTKQEAGKAQALQHFALLIDEGKISEETIRRVIKAFYSPD
jgi:hypothetical protein